MVIEQGTIIDRIDYNIENTSIKVEDGVQQLKKAAQYQRNDRKMQCIVILAVIVMIELLILALTKFRWHTEKYSTKYKFTWANQAWPMLKKISSR